jgi:DNA-binding MarR family transcriptional regulator
MSDESELDGGQEIDAVARALDRLGTWLRRVTPGSDWNSVALSSLDRVIRQGPRRITDLVAEERISQPGMTGLIGRMEEAGLVTRRPDPRDGRATLVTATEAGVDYLRRLHQERARAIDARLQRLPSAHRQALAEALTAIDALSDLPVVPGEA